MSEEVACVKCGEDTCGDQRTLWMKCLYKMNELKVPFKEIDGFFTLTVCKKCRGSWMSAIEAWFNEKAPQAQEINSGIFVRKNGSTVEISEEEWFKAHPDRQPVRWKK